MCLLIVLNKQHHLKMPMVIESYSHVTWYCTTEEQLCMFCRKKGQVHNAHRKKDENLSLRPTMTKTHTLKRTTEHTNASPAKRWVIFKRHALPKVGHVCAVADLVVGGGGGRGNIGRSCPPLALSRLCFPFVAQTGECTRE